MTTDHVHFLFIVYATHLSFWAKNSTMWDFKSSYAKFIQGPVEAQSLPPP